MKTKTDIHLSSRQPFNDETTVDLSPLLDTDEAEMLGLVEDGEGNQTVAVMEADLILLSHPDDKHLGERYRLAPRTSLDIGRSPLADLSFPDVLSLSRLHARVHHTGEGVEIEDRGSTNGTFVNDRPVEGRVTLASGDRVQAGSVHFKLLHERDPEHAYHEAIHQLVVSDGLTQACNRRKFLEELEREMGRARRHRRPLSLILFDVDYFKKVNDSHGHLCGDFVLQQIVRRLRPELRSEQLLARVGGEEFAVLNPETDLAGACSLAERLRSLVETRPFVCGETQIPVTCSFGAAALAEGMAGTKDLYAAADRALYVAKDAGRNRVHADDVA